MVIERYDQLEDGKTYRILKIDFDDDFTKNAHLFIGKDMIWSGRGLCFSFASHIDADIAKKHKYSNEIGYLFRIANGRFEAELKTI